MMKNGNNHEYIEFSRWEGLEEQIQEQNRLFEEIRERIAAMERFVSEVPEHTFKKQL